MDSSEKKELFGSLYIEAGAALLDCQTLELGISLLLHDLSRLGHKELDEEFTMDILENKEKRTLGQLFQMLKKYASVSDGIKIKLKEALEARNIIIHRFIIDNSERIAESNQERESVIEELRILRSKVRKGDNSIRPFVDGLTEALDKFDVIKFKEKAFENFAQQLIEKRKSSA